MRSADTIGDSSPRWRTTRGISLALLLIFGSITTGHCGDFCVRCVKIRLEHPVVVRGPSSNEPDAPISLIRLSDGAFRGFAANAVTIAIDGRAPLDLGGPGKIVLKPGTPGSPSECGRWLTSILPRNGSLYGIIHNEQHCHYSKGETHKSMSIAISHDEGGTWDVLGQIITGQGGDIANAPSGVGDCTAVSGHDGYWYAYCLRARDWKNIVARAPAADPMPGKWKEWDGRSWSAPALGGLGAPLKNSPGMSAAYLAGPGVVMLVNATTSGVQLSFSGDKRNFAVLPAPLIAYDANDWQRPAPTELYAYPALIADTGLNDISHDFILAYLYVPPGADFTQRYLIMQKGQIDLARAPVDPQVTTALTRWSTADGVSWATTGPPIATGHSYKMDASLGYLMTAEPHDSPSVQLDECFSPQTGNGFLAETGTCTLEYSLRRRGAGYVYKSPRAGAAALVSCLAKNGSIFISNHEDCESAGTRERILGYALQ